MGSGGVRKGTPDNDGEVVGPDQVFEIFVSKMKSEGMVGSGNHINLGFLKEGDGAVGHLGNTKGERERDLAFRGGPEVTGRPVFFPK